jgi:hypothetical protein
MKELGSSIPKRLNVNRTIVLIVVITGVAANLYRAVTFPSNANSNFSDSPQERLPLYGDASEESARILLRAAQIQRPVNDEQFNQTVEAERCQRYNLEYKGRTTRRRVFYGSLIADDSWTTISTAALENYGLFHTASFVESNLTQMNIQREMRFAPASENLDLLQKRGLFGPETKVEVDYYFNEDRGLNSLGRENDQRALIIERWRQNGMGVDDIGYLGDVDEMFSRDFMRAMMICEVEQFDHHDHCKGSVKAIGSTVVFEGGPLCITKRRWYHPDLIIGECIEGIGDSTIHPTFERTWKGTGWLSDGYRELNTTHGPLHNAADFRMTGGGFMYSGGVGFNYVGYHFHNFFPSIEVLRKKYKTYGHPVNDALDIHLGSIHEDVASMVYCGLGQPEKSANATYPLEENSLESLKGPLPLAFEVEGYVDTRMKVLRAILQIDVKKHLVEKVDGAPLP